jgi:hypothetical protein
VDLKATWWAIKAKHGRRRHSARGRVGMPHADPEVDPPQLHAALAADAAVPTLPGRLILRGRQTRGAIRWLAPGQRSRSPTAAPLLAARPVPQPGTVVSGANGISGSSRASFASAPTIWASRQTSSTRSSANTWRATLGHSKAARPAVPSHSAADRRTRSSRMAANLTNRRRHPLRGATPGAGPRRR